MDELTISNSGAFSDKPIVLINELSAKIDPRLFLFCYYSPKEYPSRASYQLKFIYAITNTYGLFWDCGSFVKNSLVSVSPKYLPCGLFSCYESTIARREANQVRSFLDIVSSFRTFFCHNFYNESFMNITHYQKLIAWATRYAVDFGDFENLPDSSWKILLDNFLKETNQVLDLIKIALKKVNSSDAIIKERIIDLWIDLICEFYLSSGMFVEFAQGLYDYSRHAAAPFRIIGPTTYSMTTNWLISKFGSMESCKTAWDRAIRDLMIKDSSPKPAYPIAFAEKILSDLLL